MITRRIIPCLDIRRGRVVKGVRFAAHRDMGDAVQLARRYAAAGADELVLYDITASPEGRCFDADLAAAITREVDIPFCVAGGIRSPQDAAHAFAAGADKISINTPALQRPELITQLASRFGSQAVVVGIDVLDGNIFQNTGDEAAIKASGKTLINWAVEAADRGAGELVINVMSADGTKNGYDADVLDEVCRAVSVPVIASGGAGCAQHFAEVFHNTDVSGALAATIFHEDSVPIPALKRYLLEANIPVRIT